MRFTPLLGVKSMLWAAVGLGVTAALLAETDSGSSVAAAATGAPVASAATTSNAAATGALAPGASRSSSTSRAAAARKGSSTTAAGSSSPAAAPAAAGTGGARKPVFVTYYLWWTANHWQQRLGGQRALVHQTSTLPATLDASGCGARSNLPGNQLTDIPTGAGYDQAAPGTIERDVRLAASLGVTGFAVNWNGTGTSRQTPSSTAYNQRLQSVVDAVHKVNAEGIPFRLMLSYKASATKLSTSAISGDMAYFTKSYGNDPAFDRTYARRPEMIWAGSWKYSSAELATVSGQFRRTLFLIGDEKPSTWNSTRAAQLDGASYYWSSQDPWKNPGSFAQVRQLADAVHAGTNPDGHAKTWLAPFTPGYNAQLLYGTSTCVPRRGGQTMQALFRGNQASRPDGWTFISWNEIAEGSYIVPLSRYGQTYTNLLKTLIAHNG
jgi:hypothetical protein